MPTSSPVVYNVDTVLNVIRTNGQTALIGFNSEFTQVPHPNTSNVIAGWVWDKQVWSTELEKNNVEYAPTIWDPAQAGLTSSGFQSGIGDNTDCKVLEIDIVNPSGLNTWSPLIDHGYYYDHDTEGYLFSDWSITQRVEESNTVSGVSFIDLIYKTKPGIPITLTKYIWNSGLAEYDQQIKAKKRLALTGTKDITGIRKSTQDSLGNLLVGNLDTTTDEFILDERFTPPRAYSNKNLIQVHGAPIASGVLAMEQLGVSQGLDNEEFHLLHSPVISSGVQVISYTSTTSYTAWTPVSEITTSGQVKIDYDLGIITFGTGTNYHPVDTAKVAAYYKSTAVLEYEKELTADTLTAIEVNVNPITKTSDSGFLLIKKSVIEPYKLVLTAEAPLISPNYYGPIYLGSSFLILDAKVTSLSGDPVEGAVVTFNLLKAVGSLSGGATSVDALSDFNGVAKTTFAAPASISNIGAITATVTPNDPSPGYTSLIVSGVNITGDANNWYIYSVFTDDPILGTDSLSQYYTDYFTAEGITGPTATDLHADGTGWENTHRLLTNLLTPNQYSAAFRNGKKQLVTTWSNAAYNPHTFTAGAYVPVRPESYSVTSSGDIKVVVSGLLPLPSSSPLNNRLAGYLVAGPTVATIEATVYNQRIGTTINSNTIQLDVRVPPSMDGTVLIETLNLIQQSGIFSGVVSPPASGVLPLGFRIRSSGVTVAGVLDGLTYIDVNRQSDVLAQSFTIIDSGVI